jgi:hypothetical protein
MPQIPKSTNDSVVTVSELARVMVFLPRIIFNTTVSARRMLSADGTIAALFQFLLKPGMRHPIWGQDMASATWPLLIHLAGVLFPEGAVAGGLRFPLSVHSITWSARASTD